MTTGSRKSTKTGVRAPYTFEDVRVSIAAQHSASGENLSLRKIAKRYGVTHAAVQRVLSGDEPKSPRIRLAFGLPEYQTVQVCPIHGVVHVAKRCPSAPTKYHPHPVVRWSYLEQILPADVYLYVRSEYDKRRNWCGKSV